MKKLLNVTATGYLATRAKGGGSGGCGGGGSGGGSGGGGK